MGLVRHLASSPRDHRLLAVARDLGQPRQRTLTHEGEPSWAHHQTSSAYIDVGLGTVRFELIGPPTDQSLRQWLQDDYDRIIPPAPW